MSVSKQCTVCDKPLASPYVLRLKGVLKPHCEECYAWQLRQDRFWHSPQPVLSDRLYSIPYILNSKRETIR